MARTAPLDVYLDHAATTPMRADAVEAMLPFLTDRFANASGTHRAARDARRALDEARDVVAAVVGSRPGEVVFTGCGTESDNAAIAGAAGRGRGGGGAGAAPPRAAPRGGGPAQRGGAGRPPGGGRPP
ncbi:MAG: aminotransferase class V-fold PLP-dependent enzyme, partial [Ilumatobacteraceae bacterium]